MTEPADYGYDDAAALIKMSPWWLKKHIRELPHQRYGRAVRFTPEQIAEIRRRFAHQPDDATPTAPVDSLRPSTRTRRTA